MAEVELIMPKMGESIIEATIINWLKQEGEHVDEDETVLEIATDKVDTEVPAPVAGIITKILHHKDAVVAVGAPLAIIDVSSGSAIAIKTSDTDLPQQKPIPKENPQPEKVVSSISSASAKTIPTLTRQSLTNYIPSNVDGRFYSPLVRNIARAEGISLEEISSLKGSGADGRVTKFDLLNYIDLKKIEGTTITKRQEITHIPSTPVEHAKTTNSIQQTGAPQLETEFSQPQIKKETTPKTASFSNESGDEIIELSRMRKVIASHMRKSIETSAHVTTFIEADTTRIVQWRKKVKDEYLRRYQDKLTFSPLFAEAVIKALRDFPRINGSLAGDQLVVKKSINLGIATAMDNGNLIVPIIHDAGDLNLHGLAKKLNSLTSRARVNKLKPEEIRGGTFTISNIGTFGNIMGTPIINQPELAILALGAIKKKPIIQETSEGDIIAIRHMMFLSLSFDHRVIDGYQGGVFLNRIAHYIENFDTNRPI